MGESQGELCWVVSDPHLAKCPQFVTWWGDLPTIT